MISDRIVECIKIMVVYFLSSPYLNASIGAIDGAGNGTVNIACSRISIAEFSILSVSALNHAYVNTLLKRSHIVNLPYS